MNWNDMFSTDKKPDFNDMERYIGQGATLWRELCLYLEETYQTKPAMAYSKCAAQPGWNVKYQKSGKSLCTLYPMDGYFIALVVIGVKEEPEVDLALNMFTPYIADMYRKVSFSCGGRWLMIQVSNKAVLNDVKSLIATRVKPKVKMGN